MRDVEIVFEFEDFQFDDGTGFAVIGEAVILGEVEARYGEIENWKVDDIWLASDKHEDGISIDDRHPLWTAIMAGLNTRVDAINEQLFRQCERDHGPFRSLEADRRADYEAAVR
jgi:hypothetical protein